MTTPAAKSIGARTFIVSSDCVVSSRGPGTLSVQFQRAGRLVRLSLRGIDSSGVDLVDIARIQFQRGTVPVLKLEWYRQHRADVPGHHVSDMSRPAWFHA